MIKRILFCAATLAVIGCTDNAMESTVNEPVLSVVAIAGNDNQAFAGYPVPSPLRAMVTADGVPKAGVSVAWSVNSGVIDPAVSRTDSLGIATARWTLGNEPGSFNAVASVEAPGHPSAHFIATAASSFVVDAIAVTNGQVAQVASFLARKLQVRLIKNGAPGVGAEVLWSAEGGAITSVSATDANGVAEAVWRMPTRAGAARAYAAVSGAERPVTFLATATPGPPTLLEVVRGSAQSIPLNRQAFLSPLVAIALDEYRNPVQGVSVSWSVLSGPVLLQDAKPVATDVNGQSTARVAPFGGEGKSIVRASALGLSADFVLTVDPPLNVIVMETNGGYVFRSMQNGAWPAVDTVRVGQTVTWRLDPFDYDQHSIEFEGMQPFSGGGEFPYGSPSEVRATFTQPGTYRYRDPFYGGTGTIVVR